MALIMNKVIPNNRFHGIVVLGDWFDCYLVSTFTKNPQRLESLKSELKVGFDLLKKLEGMGFKERIFVEGNHERRIPRMLSDKAPEFYEIVMEWWAERFKHWTYVPYMEDTSIGKLNITHDVGRSGEHSTKQSLHDYQDNIIVGHNHVLDYSVRASAKGIAHVGASFGWLGDVSKVDYRHRMKCRRDWAAGFGIGYVRNDGIVYVNPKPIVQYSCEVEGKVYVG